MKATSSLLIGLLFLGKTACSKKLSAHPLVKPPRSPLDVYKDDVLWPFDLEDDKIGCSAACSVPLMDTLKNLIRQGSNSEVMQSSCKHYEEAVECMDALPQCGTHDVFDKLMSGLKYMCVEQRPECSKNCRMETVVTSLALKDTFVKDFEAIDKIITPHMAKIVMNEGCRIGQCMLKCYRTKLNARCDGSAGSLIAETVIRPLLTESSLDLPLGALFSAILPNQCSFLFDNKALNKLRMDPLIDKDLKRLYKDKKEEFHKHASAKLLVESIFSPQSVDAGIDPFKDVPSSLYESPIDSAHNFEPPSYRLKRKRTSVEKAEEKEKKFFRSLNLDESKMQHDRKRWEKRMEEEKENFQEDDKDYGYPNREEINAILNSNFFEIPDNGKQTSPRKTWREVHPAVVHIPKDIKVHFDGSTDSVTVLRLERTLDNADLFVTRRIEANRRYRVDIQVDEKDRGWKI